MKAEIPPEVPLRETDQSPSLVTLNAATLSHIFSSLPAQTLANLAYTSRFTKAVTDEEAVWRTALQQDYPYHYNWMKKAGTVNFRSVYHQRVNHDKNWAQGRTTAPFLALKARYGHYIAVAAARDPLPKGMILFGGSSTLSEGIEAIPGSFVGWDISLPDDRLPSGGYHMPEHGSTINPLKTIFCIAQRPGTPQVVANQGDGQSQVLEIRPNELYQPNTNDYDGDLMDTDQPPALSGVSETNQQFDIFANPPAADAPYKFVCLYNLKGHDGACATVECVDEWVLTCCFDGGLRLYKPPAASQVNPVELIPGQRHIPLDINPVTSFVNPASNTPLVGAALAADVETAVSAGNDMVVNIWDVSTQRLLSQLPGHEGWIWAVQGLDEKLNVLVSGGTDGTVRLWDRRAGKQTGMASMSQQHGGGVYPVGGLKVRPDTYFMAVGCLDDNVYVTDLRTMKIPPPLVGHTDRVARMDIVGDAVLSASFDGSAGYWRF